MLSYAQSIFIYDLDPYLGIWNIADLDPEDCILILDLKGFQDTAEILMWFFTEK